MQSLEEVNLATCQVNRLKTSAFPARMSISKIALIIGLISIDMMSGIFAASNTDANRLYEDLMMSYNRFVRPVQNDTETLVVRLGLKLSQLIDVVSDAF